MKRKIALLLSFTIALSSCTFKLTTVKYPENPELKKNDLYYFLNKTILEVDITYNKKVITKYTNGVPGKDSVKYKVKRVELTPIITEDPKELYIARQKNAMHKFFLKENIDFSFNANGSINTIKAEYTDESPAFAESIVATAIDIAKMVTIAGADPEIDQGKSFEEMLIDDISLAYKNYRTGIINKNQKQAETHLKELESLHKLLADYREKNKTLVKNTEVSFKLFVDPDDYTWNNGTLVMKITPETTDFPTDLPATRIIISDPPGESNKDLLFGEDFKTKDGYHQIPGILYRIPSTKKVQVVEGYEDVEVKLSEAMIAFPQYGNYAYAPVASKLFTNRKTTLDFDAKTGNLKAFKTESGSSSTSMGKSMQASASTLLEAIESINYDLEIRELEHMKKVKDLEASLQDPESSLIDSLKSEFDILKLRQEMDDLTNPKLSELEKLKEELEILKLQLEIEDLKDD